MIIKILYGMQAIPGSKIQKVDAKLAKTVLVGLGMEPCCRALV